MPTTRRPADAPGVETADLTREEDGPAHGVLPHVVLSLENRTDLLPLCEGDRARFLGGVATRKVGRKEAYI